MKEEILKRVLNAHKNLLIEGDISSGKTTNVLFPMIDTIISKKENLFILDSKEEYINNYYEELKEKGYNTIIINLRDMDKSEGWNPLAYPYKLYKEGNTDKALEYLDKIGKTMFYEAKEPIDSFWTNTANDFLTGITLALFEDGKEEEINFNSVNNMFQAMDKKFGTSDYLTTYFSAKDKASMAYVYASTTILAPIETKGGILATARQKLRLYVSREKLTQLMRKTTFDLDKSLERPTAIFFIARDESKYLNGLASMFIEQLYGKLLEMKTNNRFNFILDNYDIIDNQNELVEMLSSCLARNIKVYLATRSLDELINKYGSYFQKLCDTITINNSNVVLTINNEKETVSKDFKEVYIPEAIIDYPTLREENIALFDVTDRAVEIKKNMFADMDVPNVSFDSDPFNVDELIRDIDAKLERLKMEEKEEAKKIDSIRSELAQFKVD